MTTFTVILAGLGLVTLAGFDWMARAFRTDLERIRTAERSWDHPRGRALLCAYPPCEFLAVAGLELVDDRGVLWPFCSREHRATGIPINETGRSHG